MEKTELQEDRNITKERITKYKEFLVKAEKRKQTIEKYMRDVGKLKSFLDGRELTKELFICYKEHLENCGEYTPASINSFLSAANSFCEQMGWLDLRIKTIRIQQQVFESEDTELTSNEYQRLIKTALWNGNERLALIIQTLGSTGIRISELAFVTVESLGRGMSDVYNKGKVRRIMYPKELIKVLKAYVKKHGIENGSIFCTRTGRQLDRSNVWREMKKLCREANVSERKVFPHNLRHLFARCFYKLKRDIVLLSDVLGHTNISTTRLYIKSMGKEHQRQLDRMHMVISGENYFCQSGQGRWKTGELMT